MEYYLPFSWNSGWPAGECAIHQGGNNKRRRWMGVGKRAAVYVRYALVLYIFNSLSCLSARE